MKRVGLAMAALLAGCGPGATSGGPESSAGDATTTGSRPAGDTSSTSGESATAGTTSAASDVGVPSGDGSSGTDGVPASCPEGAFLLHHGYDAEAVAWHGGRFWLSGGVLDGPALLDPCSGELDLFRPNTVVFGGFGGSTMACDFRTAEVYPSDDLGEPMGAPFATSQSCRFLTSRHDDSVSWLSINDDDQLQLISTAGVVDVIDLPVSNAASELPAWPSRLKSLHASGVAHFLALDDESTLHGIDSLAGATWPIANNVSDVRVRGGRVFYLSNEADGVRVYDASAETYSTLPTAVLNENCVFGSYGDWYRLPPADETQCNRDRDQTVAHTASGEIFQPPDGLFLDFPLPSGELVLAGASVWIWDPSEAQLELLWDEPQESVLAFRSTFRPNNRGIYVVDDRDGVPHPVVLPLNGSPPYELLGPHPAQYVLFEDENGVLALSPDQDLIRYDRESSSVEVLATDVTGWLPYYDNLPPDHPPHFIVDRFTLPDESDKEIWFLPLTVQ